MTAMNRTLKVAALEIWLPLILLALWWFVSAASPSVYFPPLESILKAFQSNWLDPQTALANLIPSLKIVLFGFGLAVVVGVIVGVVLGLTRKLEEAIRPLLEAIRAVPPVALLPVFVVLLGIDQTMRVFLVAFGAWWPVLLNTIDGVRAVEPVLLDAARAFRINRFQKLVRIILPSAMPQIFAGARIALAISLIIMVVAETVGADGGIGYFLLKSERDFAITNMWSAIIALGVLGYLLNIIFRLLEARVLRWHHLQQARLKGN